MNTHPHVPHLMDDGIVCGGEPCPHDVGDGYRAHDFGEHGERDCPHPPECRQPYRIGVQFCAHCGQLIDRCPAHAEPCAERARAAHSGDTGANRGGLDP